MPVWWALLQMHKQPMLWSAQQQQQLSGSSCPPEQHMQAALQLPRPALCTSWSKTHCGHWPLISLCFPGLSLGRFLPPEWPFCTTAHQGTRQPRSIFRLWRIPLGSPFQSDKVSHCKGEAKTHIRPTDPALTREHRSELPGLQRFKGGRWLQVHVGRQPKEQHPGAKPSAVHCSWGWSPITWP